MMQATSNQDYTCTVSSTAASTCSLGTYAGSGVTAADEAFCRRFRFGTGCPLFAETLVWRKGTYRTLLVHATLACRYRKSSEQILSRPEERCYRCS